MTDTATYALDIARQLVNATCRLGADIAEVYLKHGPTTRITWQSHCMSQSRGWESDLALRAWRNGRGITVTTSNFSSQNLEKTAQLANRQLKRHGFLDRPLLPLATEPLIFPAAANEAVTASEKISVLQALLASVNKSWPLATTILNASYVEDAPWIVLVNSCGFAAAYQTKRYAIWAWVEGTNGHLVTATSSQRFTNLNLEAIEKYLYERVVFRQQKVSKAPNGRYQVLFSPHAAADLAHALGDLLTGENVLHRLQPLRQRLNTPIAAPSITLIDDSTLAGGRHSRPLDDEGTITQNTTLIENGKLKNLLHTRQTANLFDAPANGKAIRSNLWQSPHSAPSNIYIQAGNQYPTQLRQQMVQGLIVTGVLEAGRIQGSAGNFTIVVQGNWVENKQVAYSVGPVRLSLNIFELLRNIHACGNDWQISPLAAGAGAPSILVENVQVES